MGKNPGVSPQKSFLPTATVSNIPVKKSTQHGFNWSIIPKALGVVASIGTIGLAILLSQTLQLYVGCFLLAVTSMSLYQAFRKGVFTSTDSKTQSAVATLQGQVQKHKADNATLTSTLASTKVEMQSRIDTMTQQQGNISSELKSQTDRAAQLEKELAVANQKVQSEKTLADLQAEIKLTTATLVRYKVAAEGLSSQLHESTQTIARSGSASRLHTPALSRSGSISLPTAPFAATSSAVSTTGTVVPSHLSSAPSARSSSTHGSSTHSAAAPSSTPHHGSSSLPDNIVSRDLADSDTP